MRHVVLGDQKFAGFPQSPDGTEHMLRHPHLDAQNRAARLLELLVPGWRRLDGILEDPVPRPERIIVEDYRIQVVRLDERLLQTIVDGVLRKARVVFLTGEPLLLGCGDDLAVADNGRRGIMIERRNPQNRVAHGRSSVPARTLFKTGASEAARPACPSGVGWTSLANRNRLRCSAGYRSRSGNGSCSATPVAVASSRKRCW